MSFWGQFGFQDAASSVMELISFFHDYMMMLLLGILVFVTYIFVYLSTAPLHDKYSMDSHLLETIWTVVPMVILIFMAFPSLYLLYLMEDISNPSVTVKVIGHQWYWEYQYSNSWSTVSFDSYMVYEKNGVLHYSLDVDNRLVLPSAVPLLFLVSSQDVIHSWAVPCLGVKADAIPGRMNSLSSEINSSGVYYGQCSEICGANHSFMPIVLEVIPPAAFLNHLEKLS